MEHIVQFAISIDDEAIVEKVKQSAEKTIINDLKQQVVNRIFEGSYYRKNANPEEDRLSEFSKHIIREAVEKNRDIIIDKAAKLLAKSLAQSRKGKEILDNLEDNEL